MQGRLARRLWFLDPRRLRRDQRRDGLTPAGVPHIDLVTSAAGALELGLLAPDVIDVSGAQGPQFPRKRPQMMHTGPSVQAA